ncbi:MAG TPA: MATE family efflux transporter, partial [Clostridiaceae bacterium]
MDRSNELGNENVWKLLIKFSIPAVIGMLVNALYSVVDRIFVGRGVGSIALSGVAVTFPITNIIMAVGMLVGIGSAAVVS